MAEKVEELKFPMEFPKCVCGYEGHGLVVQALEEKKKKGRVVNPAVKGLTVVLCETFLKPQSLDVFSIMWEVCPKCGTMRALKADVVEATKPASMMPNNHKFLS